MTHERLIIGFSLFFCCFVYFFSSHILISIIEIRKKLEQIYEKYGDKIKYIGVSNYNLTNISRLISSCKYKPYANQIEYSPFNQRDELVDYCLQNNIKIFAYNIFLKGSKHLDEIQLNDKYRIIIAWLILKKIKSISLLLKISFSSVFISLSFKSLSNNS
mgnify:CR=1 FL=1